MRSHGIVWYSLHSHVQSVHCLVSFADTSYDMLRDDTGEELNEEPELDLALATPGVALRSLSSRAEMHLAKLANEIHSLHCKLLC